MPKKNQIAIYELLFKEGVMVAKKDVHMSKYPEREDKNRPNLHIMKAMQSWSLETIREGAICLETYLLVHDEQGHEYLRDDHYLPLEMVPATTHRSCPETGRPQPKGPEWPARLTKGEANTYRKLCLLVLRLGLAHQLNSSLESALVWPWSATSVKYTRDDISFLPSTMDPAALVQQFTEKSFSGFYIRFLECSLLLPTTCASWTTW